MPKKKSAPEFDAQASVMRGMDVVEARDGLDHVERAKWLNASEAGTCIRKQWYAAHQPETADRDERGYARRGHAGEVYMVNALRAANVPLLFAGEDQVNLQDPSSRSSGTPDGVLDWDKAWEPLDLKTKDPRFNMSNLPKTHHVVQMKINMELIRKHLLPDGVALKGGWLIYMDASNFDDITQFWIEAEPGFLEAYAEKRARKKLRTKNVDRLDREGKTAGGKECRNECDFRIVCGVTEVEASPRRRGNRGSKFEGIVMDYADADTKEKAGKDRKTELKEMILAELKRKKTDEIVVGDFTVSVTRRASSSFDKKGAFAAAEKKGLDLSAFNKPGAGSVSLSVKRAT